MYNSYVEADVEVLARDDLEAEDLADPVEVLGVVHDPRPQRPDRVLIGFTSRRLCQSHL